MAQSLDNLFDYSQQRVIAEAVEAAVELDPTIVLHPSGMASISVTLVLRDPTGANAYGALDKLASLLEMLHSSNQVFSAWMEAHGVPEYSLIKPELIP